MKTTKTTTQSTRVTATREAVSAELAKANLEPQIENVLRMRFGLGVQGNTALSFRGQAVEESRVKLAMIEHDLLSDFELAMSTPEVEENKARLLSKLQDMADDV